MTYGRVYLLRRRVRCSVRLRAEVPTWDWPTCWAMAGVLQRNALEMIDELRSFDRTSNEIAQLPETAA